MRTTVIWLATLFSLLSAQSRATDPPIAERPMYKDGDVFEYVERFQTVACKRWEMIGRDADGSWLSQCDDNIAHFSAETGALQRIVRKDGRELVTFLPSAPAIPFPLQLGKKWGGKFQLSMAGDIISPTVDETCEVVSFETVKVAAGDFPAFRFECTTAWLVWPFHGNVTVTMWYAPAAKSLVKVSNSSDPKWDTELARYSLK